MYYYLLWWGPEEGFHLGPSALLHKEKIPEEKLESWVRDAVAAGARGRKGVLEHLVQQHSFTRPELAGFTYVEFP